MSHSCSKTVKIIVSDWQDLQSDATAIRGEVFVKEQNVPIEIELDEMDSVCIHAVAYVDDERMGTGRLLPDGHIGRMAVLKTARGLGVGGKILQTLIDKARERGDQEVILSAQVHAIPFYERFGFVAEGPVYKDANIDHRDMRLKLQD